MMQLCFRASNGIHSFYQDALGNFCSKRCVSGKVRDSAGYVNVKLLSARWHICLLPVFSHVTSLGNPSPF
jgi:hypothetical protein